MVTAGFEARLVGQSCGQSVHLVVTMHLAAVLAFIATTPIVTCGCSISTVHVFTVGGFPILLCGL